MRPLLSSRQSLDLDEHIRQLLDFSDEMLMEIAAGKLWEALNAEILADGEARHRKFRESARNEALNTSIAAVCGKGDNAGDALAMLRHAKINGYSECAAYIPAHEELKEATRKNLLRAERCGVSIHLYDTAAGHEASFARELARYDVVLDAVLGTGARGPARTGAAYTIAIINTVSEHRDAENNKHPRIVSIDVPSGLSDTWQHDYPIVRADVTLGIEPLKEAIYIPAARPYAGEIIPVSGIFSLWTEKSSSKAFLAEASDVGLYLPPVSAWAHKMQRGRVAILAGSATGAGAALHCVRGALAAGAGYIALYCDDDLVSSYLATVGDTAIVRAYKEENFSPEMWDVIIAGPGWGTESHRKSTLEKLLDSTTTLLLDADAIRLYANIAENLVSSEFALGAGTVILTPHPGEFKDLLPLINDLESSSDSQEFDASETVRQTVRLATRLRAIVALRASTTHIAAPGGDCAIFDGSTPGLGIAGSGDVFAGLAGGLIARRKSQLREKMKNGASVTDSHLEELFKAVVGAVLVHGISGARLSERKGWFTPVELAEESARITSKTDSAENGA